MAPFLSRMDIFPSKVEYANHKVKTAIREHEGNIDARRPLKVVLLGNSGVGKTSIIKGGAVDIHPPPATVGACFEPFEIPVGSDVVRLQVWDTAGQEKFRCMVPMYMRNAAAAIIVFDVTNRQSFEDVNKWENELTRSCSFSEPTILLVGNKSDLAYKRQVAYGEAVKKAHGMNALYIEMSAKQSKFQELLQDIASHSSSPPRPFLSNLVLLQSSPSEPEKATRSCCPLQ